MDDAKEDETNDAEEETPEEKNIAKTTETEENLQVQDEDLGNDSENSSFKEPQTEDAEESTLVKKEAQVEKSIDSLQVAPEDVEASISCQETSHLEEESLITDAEDVKTFHGIETKEETSDDKNFGTEIPHEHTEENSVTQVDCSQKEDLEKDSENSTKASAEVSNGDESKHREIDSLQAELENKENTGNTSFKEEAQVEKSIDSLQPAPEDITASDSSQNTNISVEEKVLTTYPQEISRDKTKEEPFDAAEESLEVKDIATNIIDNDKEDTSPIEEDASEKPSCKEATEGNNKDEESTVTPEAKFVVQNEKDAECPLVKEEVSLESSQVEAQDVKETSSVEDQSLKTNAQEIIDDSKEITSDAAGMEEETLEDKQNIAESTPYEDIGEKTVVHLERSGLEQNEVLEKDSGKASISEAPAVDTTENILVKEEAQDHHIESLQVATEVTEARASCQETSSLEEVGDRDIKASALGQDKETSSLEGQSLTTNPQDTMDEAKEDETNDAEEKTAEEKNIAKTTLYEEKEENLQKKQNEDSGNDGENSSFTETQTEDAAESTLVKKEAQLEKSVESLQVAPEDVEASASSQETSHLEEESLITDTEEVKTVDELELKEETPDDKNFGTAIPHEHIEEHLVTQVDCSQKEDLEKNIENSTEASAEVSNGDESKNKEIDSSQAELENEESTGNTSFKEEAQVEKSIDSLQPASEVITASDSSQDTNTFIHEKMLTAYPKEISRDKTEEEAFDAADRSEESLEVKDTATNIINNDKEDTSPIEEDASEKPSCEEATEGNSKDEESTVTPEAKIVGQNEKDAEFPLVKKEVSLESSQVEAQDVEAPTSTEVSIENKGIDSLQAELEIEENTGNTSFEEEALMQKPIDSSQPDPEDITASDLSQNTNISVEEKILTTYPQEISRDKTEEEPIHAADTSEESLECIARNTPDNYEEDSSPIEEDGSEKPSLEDGTTGNNKDELPIVSAEAKLGGQNEKDTECPLVKEEESIESSHVEAQDIKAATSGQDKETSSLEDKDDIAESTLYEETGENKVVQVDHSGQEQNEVLERDSGKTSLSEAPTMDTTENTLVKEEAQAQDHHIESLQVANEVIDARASCQETSYIEEKIPTADSQEITFDHKMQKIIDSSDCKEETHEDKDIVEDVPRGDDEDNSPTEKDGSQKPSFEETITEDANDHDSATTQEAELLEESSTKADLFRKEKTTEDTLVEEDASIEPLEVVAEDIKASSSIEGRKPISQEEQILNANPGGFMSEEKQEKTVDQTEQKETPQDEEAKEIEDVDTEPRSTELKEEEGDFQNPQLTTAVNVSAPEENDSNSTAVEIPFGKDLDINEDGVEHPVEDPSCKQEESSTTKVPEEHMTTSPENIPEITSLESEVSVQKNDHTVVEEEKSCGDKTETKEIGVMDDDSVTIPTNQTLAETDPRGSTDAEVQLPDGEQKAELVQQDPEKETAPEGIEEWLLTNSSQAVSESEVKGEERVDSDNCKEILESSKFVASEEISPSNVASEEDSTSSPFQESKRQTREEAENEGAQEPDEEFIQDSSMEKVEKDVQQCVESAIDSDITQKMPELEEPPLSATDESITETTECKEAEVVEKVIKNEDEEDGTKSLLDDKKATGEEKEETESKQETTVSTSVPVANDFIPISASEPSKVDDSIAEREVALDTEELHSEETATDESATKTDKNRIDEEQKSTDFSPAAQNMEEARSEDVSTLMSEAKEEDFTEKCTEEANEKTIDTTEGTTMNESTSLEGILVDNRSIADLESTIDDEAPEISETTPIATEGESTSVGKLNEKKSDSNEIPCEIGKQKSEYESKTQVLESVPQDQSCETISDKEVKTEEKNLEAAETKSVEVVSVDISEEDDTTYEKEIMEDNISGEKTKDEDVEGYHRSSCEEKVITEIGEEVSQEEEITTEKDFEVTKIDNATEKVPETSKEADDMAPKESHPQETEQVKSAEEVTAILDTKEAHELDITSAKTGTQGSNEEINNSSAALLENEDTKTRASDTDDGKERDELLTQESNIPEKEAAARELTKELGENTTCEAPPSDAVHSTTVDMQPQEEDGTPEHEILPLLQSAQRKECEEQNQKDEVRRSDEVQPDFEDNMMLSARTNEEENKADTWGTPKDEDTKIDVEAEKLDNSSQNKEILEVSINNDIQDIPKDSEDSATKDKPSEESQIPTVNDQIEQASEDTRVTNDVQEFNAEIDSLSAIPNATAEISDKCEVMEETKLQALPEEFSFRNHEDKIAENKYPLNLQNERGISKDVQGLNEESKKENPVEADADEIEHAPMSKALIEQHQLGRTSENVSEGVICEEKETIQSQIDSIPILPDTKSSNSETAEKDPPGSNCTDVTESEAIPLPSKDSKPDEEKDDEEEPEEQKGTELSSEAPVMVDIGDADVKSSNKKSHNILSGVGSKVKHSIAKVKKAITGKSSHPKPPSPKKVLLS